MSPPSSSSSSSSPLSPLLPLTGRDLLRIRSEVLYLASVFCFCVPEPWFACILRNILPVCFIASILPEELELRVKLSVDGRKAASKMFLLSAVFIDIIWMGKSVVERCVDRLSLTSAASERFLQKENFSTEIENIVPEKLPPMVKVWVDSLSSMLAASKRFLQRENFSTEIKNIVPEKLPPMVKVWVDSLSSMSAASKRSAAAKLRLLAKQRDDCRVLIADSGAIPGLVLLLKSTDGRTQEHAVTALFNLSLCRRNKQPIAETLDAIESIIYVLNTGTETSKQNAAAALSSLAENNKETRLTIGAHGAIWPLVALLREGSLQGKKDALMALCMLCLEERNNERAVIAVGPLVGLVAEQGSGVAEKAMMVLRSLARIRVGRTEIVENGGIPALVKAIDESSLNGKELAVFTLLQLCKNSVEHRELMVAAGGIRALVKAIDESSLIGKELVVMTLLQLCESVEKRGLVVDEGGICRLEVLSRIGTEAKTLLGYLTEARNQEVASSSSP